LLEFAKGPSPGWTGEERSVQVSGSEPAHPADDDLVAFLLPLEGGPRTDTQLLPDGCGDRDLALGGELGLGDGHDLHYPGNLSRPSVLSPRGRANTRDQLRGAHDLALVYDDRADHGAATRLQPPLVSSCIALLGGPIALRATYGKRHHHRTRDELP
jgi:hypothetical protein